MKLKSLVIAVVLALGSSCTNAGNSFYISKFYPLAPGCDFESLRETYFSPNGYLDVAAGNPQFFVGVELIGGELVTQPAVTLGQTTLEAANRNRPVVTRRIITYKLSKRLGTTPASFETAYVAPFSDNGTLFMTTQLISPELGQTLVDGLLPSDSISEEFVDITVDLEFRGEYTATRTPFSTGVYSYPIRAYRSNTSCATKFRQYKVDAMFELDTCDYAGQSTSQSRVPPPPYCCPPPPTMGSPSPGC